MTDEELNAIEERFGHNGPLPYGDLRDGHALIAEVRRLNLKLKTRFTLDEWQFLWNDGKARSWAEITAANANTPVVNPPTE